MADEHRLQAEVLTPEGEVFRGDLFQLGRDEQHRAPLVAQCNDLAVNELDGADVHATRRLRHEQKLWR